MRPTLLEPRRAARVSGTGPIERAIRMHNRDIIAIGTSAGGVEALRFLARGFPRDFPASVLGTIHLTRRFESSLDSILSQAGPLPASFARDREALQKSRIYIAPPQRHLIVEPERLLLGNGPRDNSARPAIDPMFRSAALCCGLRSIGVVLTGSLGDGASGLFTLKQCGGITVVQDPDEAGHPEMPLTALSRSKPDHVARLADLPALLASLVRLPAGPPAKVPEATGYEVEIAKDGAQSKSAMNDFRDLDKIGRRSVLACPDCGGVMWECTEGDVVRYRCHVGHAYTAEVMSLALDENLRRALASALRALDERVALAQSLQHQAIEKGRMMLAEIWGKRAQEHLAEAEVIRGSLRRVDELAAAFARSKGSEAA
ncbi:MAG TPA: chemotaxis protein CheB [Methylocella sp.]|nr:chemotaxis protein CheB [Methylocella sp.]